MNKRRVMAGVAVAAALAMASPASAGIDWFGVSFRVGGVQASLGYSDYPVYSDHWHDPAWSMDYDLMLDGYGQWVVVGGLGRVWRPWVRADWRPFSHGRWVWTSMGWSWVSYEPWGYVPHHYGNWAYSPAGWVWVPGYRYVAANVVWVRHGSYLGWMPMGPSGWSHSNRGFRRGYNRGFEDGYRRGEDRGYRDGYADGWNDHRVATWVHGRDLGASNIASHARSPREIGRVREMRALPAAPLRQDVERISGVRIPQTQVERRSARVGDRTVDVIRPVGVERDIQAHARRTVERGLAPEVSRKLERGERVTTRVAPARPARETARQQGRDEVRAPQARGGGEVDRRVTSRDARRDTGAAPRDVGAATTRSAEPRRERLERQNATGREVRRGETGETAGRPTRERAVELRDRDRGAAAGAPRAQAPARVTERSRSAGETARVRDREPEAAGASRAPARERATSREQASGRGREIPGARTPVRDTARATTTRERGQTAPQVRGSRPSERQPAPAERVRSNGSPSGPVAQAERKGRTEQRQKAQAEKRRQTGTERQREGQHEQ